MGMYDEVRYSDNCKNCGAELTDFQTKDHKNLLNQVEPSQVDNFYTNCDKCDTWHEYTVTRECVVKHIEVTTSKGIT